MTYFRDLTPLVGSLLESSACLAVGWLEPEYEYPQGALQPRFIERLSELLVDPWQPFVHMGTHDCGFCRLTGGPGQFTCGHTTIQMKVNNLFIPAEQHVFVAPSLILHYMDAHLYCPPRAFQEAVLACPPMRSMDYLKAIRRMIPRGAVGDRKSDDNPDQQRMQIAWLKKFVSPTSTRRQGSRRCS